MATWLLFAIANGTIGAFAALMFKQSGKSVPPYALLVILGLTWFLPSAALMFSGIPGIMTPAAAAGLGRGVIVPVFVTGVLFWLDNLTRFDALNKAPLAGYVLMLVELSAALTVFIVEPVLKAVSGESVAFHAPALGGVCLALAAIGLFKYHSLLEERRREVGEVRKHFTPFGWVTLSIATGIFAGVGQLLGKGSEAAGMPPYVLVAIVGIVWTLLSVAFMAGGQRTGRLMTLSELATLGSRPLGFMAVAGLLTWVENLARFAAIHQAAFIGYVLMAVSVTNLLTVFTIELALKARYREPIRVSGWELGGSFLAVLSILAFRL